MNARDAFAGGIAPGEPMADAPIERDGLPGTLVACLSAGLTALYFANPDGSLGADDGAALVALADRGIKPLVVLPPYCPFVGEAARGRVLDQAGTAHERYDARPGTCYLVGPDRRVLGRWRRLALPDIEHILS